MSIERIPRFTGRIENGKLHLDHKELYGRFIQGLNGERVSVTIVKTRNIRSLPQNSFYWGVVIPLLREACGYDPDEMHEALKRRFLATHTDSELPTVRSTATLTTKEFAEYVEDCVRLAAEYGVVIPDPREVA